LYPQSYIKELQKIDDWFGPSLKGLKIGFTEENYGIEKRMVEMDKCNVDRLVLSLGPPGIDYFKPNHALAMARKINDEFAMLTEEYSDRFVGLATLPFQDVGKGLDEFDRVIKDLGLKGAMIFGNVAGKPLDSPEFWPFYERAAKLRVPLYIHPTTPFSAEKMMEYGLMFIVGFLFDTTLAITRIIFSGILEKYPSLKLVLAHLGSTVPYILARLDIESEGIDRRIGLPGKPISRVKISKPPSEYFKLIYLDTVSLHVPAYMCAYACMGPDKLLLGSDYPYWDIQGAVSSIEKLPISNEDKLKILGETASALLRIS
jgi:aminocarboxymuconate-semialdehyde decarboxylase